ncbi:hypothetical protein PTTG_06308 [Puccinia triticina 1-1 BBBD Race 1]|uniref:Uncharacterized protein n=2 Tax=Puccinia triticina TaxID=208348 RepID=A0A0C4EZP8_PUCT1|nr:uncharacterized protein PtA15_3A163 [Puccinia triticina]OAV96307.1 hypothetical protein PTTG_06308 [Puccinia triticina 1-1 BBBD Race 1]WAQ82799.1 hypothetical protein PtA15_3A163 [Puccinia triticina]WAR53640.1 hypothetical protein PtB15_3B148 [Puccinia triticina]
MPSYRLGPSPLELASSSQLDCRSRAHLDQIPLPTATGFKHLPSLEIDSEALLSLDKFSMITLSSAVNPLIRNSLEFSEEESFSDESICNNQRASFPDCAGFFDESFSDQSSPNSNCRDPSTPPLVTAARRRDSAKEDLPRPSSKLPFAFLSQPYKSLVHVSKPATNNRENTLRGSRSLNFRQRRLSVKMQDPLQDPRDCPGAESKGSRKQSLGSITDNQAGSNHLDVKTSPSSSAAARSKDKGSFSPECQSHTMSSVFEDDSDDDHELAYLKKVLPAWITHKKSKSIITPPPHPQPKFSKQKSRIFKSHRSSLSNTSS